MQTKIRIFLMATIAAGIGALMIGSSLPTAAFAQWRSSTSQSITQENNCAYAQCSNTGTNVAGGGGSTSQTINQENNCYFAKCSNHATNIAGWW